jgi:4-hydroxy-2-oxoglutarate aldolase
MLLNGIFPPITTPFYPDGSIYWKKLEHNVERYSRTPIAGIVVQGSTGEAIMLSDQEKRDVLRAAREASVPNKVMIAGTGIESAIETLKLTEYAAHLGYDAAMVRTPHYYKAAMTPTAVLTFYRTIADRSPLPVIIYNFPPATGYDIPAEVVIELADHPNLLSIKESAANIDKVKKIYEGTRHVKRTVTVTDQFEAVTGRMLHEAKQAVAVGELVPVGALSGGSGPSSAAVETVGSLRTRQKEVGFQVMVGAAHQLLESLDAGAVGAILAFACCAPTACFEIYQAWKERANDIARDKQTRITEAAKRIVSGLSVAGVKYAMDLNGYYGGNPRLPLLPLAAEQKAEVERLMTNIKN